jgi:hypothetical protein
VVTKRPFIRVALATALILTIPLVATLVGDEASWSLADFILAGLLLGGAGLLLELAVTRPRSGVYRVAAAAVGIAAIVFGEGDDAPGLVLFGGLLVVATVVLTFRTPQRS